MKHIYIVLFFIFFIYGFTDGQSRFFTFTEGWKTSSALEFDDYYTIIGTGAIDGNNYIVTTNLSKIGEHIDTSTIVVTNAISSSVRNQQALSCDGQRKVMGITVINESESIIKARRLLLNNDLTIVTDSSWQYVSPEGEQSIMVVTRQEKANTIIHGLNYYTGNTINSTLLSTDTLGNVIWESNFSCGGNSCWMIPHHIHPAHDGGYIFTHTEERNSNNGPSIDDHDVANIIKTDSLGVEQWRIHPGGEGNPYTSNRIVLQPTDDGNYLCVWADNWMKTTNVGHYNPNPDATMWLAKISPDGNKIWEKTLQEQIDNWNVDATGYIMTQMLRASDNNFVIAGADKLFKISQEGDIIWARHYNPLNLEFSYEQIYFYRIYGINETLDGGFIMTGEFEARAGTDFPEFLQTGFALKVDEYGCLEAGCQEDDPVVSVEEVGEASTKLSIYPNPTSQDIIINYQLPHTPDRLTLSIHNIMGKAIHTQTLPIYEGNVRIELSENLPAGTYFCHLAGDGQVIGVERFDLVR